MEGIFRFLTHRAEPLTPLAKATEVTLFGLVILSPCFFFPAIANSLVFSKIVVMLSAALIMIGLFVAKSLSDQVVAFPSHRLVLPLFLFGTSAILSSVLTGGYPVENLMGWGGVYLATALIALLGGALANSRSHFTFTTALMISGLLVSILTITQIIGVGPSRILGPMSGLDIPHTALFNLAGSAFVAAQFLILVIVGLGSKWFKTRTLTPLETSSLVMSLVALSLCVFMILPGKPATPLVLPFSAGWSIGLDVIRIPKVALLGVGPENFNAAYTTFKPQWVNQTSYWNVIFTNSSNVPLALLVTSGFIGVGTWLFIMLATLKSVSLKSDSFVAGTVALAAGLLQLVFPGTVIIFAVQAVAWAIMMATDGKTRSGIKFHITRFTHPFTPTAELYELPSISTVLPGLFAVAVVGVLAYPLARFTAASLLFYKADRAAERNQASELYELQRQAIVLNPYLSSYRSSYATTNMAIASALSNQPEPTEADKEQVAQLIQQSIREARAATVLRPDYAAHWQVLGQVYKNLIGVAEGADQWAVTAYVTAIQASPTDPRLRIELGGIFYNQKKFSEAATLFQQAAELKPDMVNAHYNLANALRELGQFEAAQATYQKTLALLDPSSEEYLKATQELEALQKQAASEATQAAKTTSPETIPAPPTATGSAQLSVPSVTQQNLSEPNKELIDTTSSRPITQ